LFKFVEILVLQVNRDFSCTSSCWAT